MCSFVLKAVTFDGNDWDHNGPRMLTNVAASLCNAGGFLAKGRGVLEGLSGCPEMFRVLRKEEVCPIPSEHYR